MKTLARFVGVSLVLALSMASAFAAPSVGVQARTLTYSCGYYTKQEGQFHVNFEDRSLPYGTQVFIEFGFAGKNGGADFSDLDSGKFETVQARSLGHGLWSAEIRRDIADRSSPMRRASLQFVVRAVLDDASVAYAKGLDKAKGYFVADAPEGQCVTSDREVGYETAVVREVTR